MHRVTCRFVGGPGSHLLAEWVLESSEAVEQAFTSEEWAASGHDLRRPTERLARCPLAHGAGGHVASARVRQDVPGVASRPLADAGLDGFLAQDHLDGRAPAEHTTPGVDGGALAGQPVAAHLGAPGRHANGVPDPARGEVLHRQGAAVAPPRGCWP